MGGLRKTKYWTMFEKYVMGLNFACKKKRIAFIFVLPHPKRGVQSVGRDHIGATLYFRNTRIEPESELTINGLIGGLKEVVGDPGLYADSFKKAEQQLT